MSKNYFLNKPDWVKIRIPQKYRNIKNTENIINHYRVNTICQAANCPNIISCFSYGVATFLILGNLCTRNCRFCNVKHGLPNTPDDSEPSRLAKAIYQMKLKHVVLTSVNRDDLHDGGASHFVKCINTIKKYNNNINIEILVPDFRNCVKIALNLFQESLPDIFSHNIESVPRLYSFIKPGFKYINSLKLLRLFKIKYPNVPIKSSIIVGLGETLEEIINTMYDLYNNGVSLLTIGQYLQPTNKHLSVKRFFSKKEFSFLKKEALIIGFSYVASGPLIRSSYRADLQSCGVSID
ncbi:MAG: lipoyl synthase [Candidatus Lightella neohaematopini]|nr:lipoyl synthase [Candidatus Lightella neohaematopini]MCV2524955.1 lipoyl synthase [Candidatus Lightella neohaematopini]